MNFCILFINYILIYNNLSGKEMN